MKKLVLGICMIGAVLLTGCQQKQTEAKLTDHAWKLTILNLNKQDVALPRDTVSVLFDTTGTVSGFSGCNRYFGGYSSAGGDNLNIEIRGRTMAACPDLETEDKFIKVLDNSTTFRIIDGVLTITDQNSGDYAAFIEFEAAAEQMPNP